MASTSPVMDAFFKSEEMEGKVSDEDLPKFTESWDAWDGAASSLAPSSKPPSSPYIFSRSISLCYF